MLTRPGGRAIAPSKARTSPPTVGKIVVLPQPEGPNSTPTSRSASVKPKSCRSSSRSPAAAVNALRLMRTSSRPASPAGCASFNGLHQDGFDQENDDHESERIGKDAG